MRSDAARRGWIPAWLPPEATEVVVEYNLDTNFTAIRFRLAPDAARELRRHLVDDCGTGALVPKGTCMKFEAATNEVTVSISR